MSRCAIIVAGGSGTRMGSTIPKQFLRVNGLPVLAHTLRAFYNADQEMQLVLVLPAAQIDTWQQLIEEHDLTIKHQVVAGGAVRSESVQNGLAQVGEAATVAVHDGVRPLISADLIQRCFKTAEEKGTAIPVTAISSSVRAVNGTDSHAVDRTTLRAVQTPQCFRTEVLSTAFEQFPDAKATDEATLVEMTGHPIQLVTGEEKNIKITTPHDLQLAKIMLSS